MKWIFATVALVLGFSVGCKCSEGGLLDQELPIEEQQEFEKLDQAPDEIDDGSVMPVEDMPDEP